jgi:hypothetical protein
MAGIHLEAGRPRISLNLSAEVLAPDRAAKPQQNGRTAEPVSPMFQECKACTILLTTFDARDAVFCCRFLKVSEPLFEEFWHSAAEA